MEPHTLADGFVEQYPILQDDLPVVEHGPMISRAIFLMVQTSIR